MRSHVRPTLVALALVTAGCGPATLPLARALPDDAPDALRTLLTPGQRVVLREGPACDAVVALDFETLLAGKGMKLSVTRNGKTPGLFRVDRSVVRLSSEGAGAGFVGVSLVDDGGAATWVRLELGQPLTCLLPADDATVAAAKLARTRVVFAPWQETCTRIDVAGVGGTSTLLENDAGAPLTITGLVSLDGDRPWVGLEHDTLRVPYDVLKSCFASAPPGVDARTGALGLLHTALGRCVRGDDAGKEHVECRSSVGVWEGRVADNGPVALRLVRRTLGPVHFTDGRPVDGRRYARTVVAVSTGRAQDERARALYAAIEGSVAKTLSEGDGSIRVAAGSDPTVGYRLLVDAADLKIGELGRQQVNATSQYQDGERDVPNPAYGPAQAAVRQAGEQVEAARRHHAEQVEQYEKNKETGAAARQTCLNACDLAQNAVQRTACRTGCEGGSAVGGALNGVPTSAEIDAAEQALGRTRDALAATPPTVKEPIMKTWTYAKTLFARSVSASLRLTLEPKGAPARVIALPLSLAWEDYETQADPAHNVPGHQPDRGPIERPETLVPWLANKASEALAEQLRAVFEQAELEDAKKALAGSDKGKPGFEAVDAKAIDAVGARLLNAAQRGRANLHAGTPSPLPSEAVTLAPGECLLAVAVAEGDATASLTLASDDGAFGDLRGKRFAAVEACGSELPAKQEAVRLGLKSSSDLQVRWGLYRTSAGVKARAVLPAAAPPIPPPAPVDPTDTRR